MKEKSSFASILSVGLKLLLICAVVAGVVSFVYNLTLEPYEANLKVTKNLAVEAIFKKENLDCREAEEGLYEVRENGKRIGYCVESAGAGFGGDIGVMVGYDKDWNIVGVQVVSHAETPGVGTKAMTEDYLQSFCGSTAEDEIDVDVVSGASFSSRGISEAVSRANARLQAAMEAGVIE